MSRTLSKAERNYEITKLETLGLVWGARQFSAYLYGHKCLAFMDHSSFKSMLRVQNMTG